MRSFVIGLVLVWSVVAAADPKEEARVHVRAADTHFKLGRFQEALDEYSKAYELFPVGPLLFNLGQCHRNLKHWERAIFFFEGYLRETPDAPNRALVEDLIREAQAQLAAQQADEKRTGDERAATERARAADAERLRLEAEQRRDEAEQRRDEAERRRTEEQLRVATTAQRAREEHDSRRFYRKWWFWTAVGGVAVAAGGSAYLLRRTVEPVGTLGGLDRR